MGQLRHGRMAPSAPRRNTPWPLRVGRQAMTHLENFCCALAIFGLAVAAGWWALGADRGAAVSGVIIVSDGRE